MRIGLGLFQPVELRVGSKYRACVALTVAGDNRVALLPAEEQWYL